MTKPSSDTASQLEELFVGRYIPMVNLAAWLLNDSALAEEIVQDVFVNLASPSFDWETVKSPSGYLRTGVVNMCKSHLRHLSVARQHPFEAPTMMPGADKFIPDDELLSALNTLPARQRECIVLRYAEDMSITEAATLLALSPGSVKQHTSRGLTALNDILGSSNKELRLDDLSTDTSPKAEK